MAAAVNNNQDDQEETYGALVIDSGPIIRLTGLASLFGRAQAYYTVPAVFHEIRDVKARQHLQNLPFDITPREASPEGIQAMIAFARQTGDYPNLSSVDLQVLGLLYDLEKEGCHGQIQHVRTTPKRTLGVGKIQQLNPITKETERSTSAAANATSNATPLVSGDEESNGKEGSSFFESQPHPVSDDDDDDNDESSGEDNDEDLVTTTVKQAKPPTSWAGLVGSVTDSTSQLTIDPSPIVVTPALEEDEIIEEPIAIQEFPVATTTDNVDGQFSDADEDDDNDEELPTEEDTANTPDKPTQPTKVQEELMAVEADLQSAFPSLAAAVYVPYEGSDDDEQEDAATKEQKAPIKLDMEKSAAILAREKAERKKLDSLKPLPKQKSGTLYNSFGKYSDVLKQKGIEKQQVKDTSKDTTTTTTVNNSHNDPFGDDMETAGENSNIDTTKSRIMGGMSMAGQGEEVEDDGEGWITSTKDIRKMKSAGVLDPSRNPQDSENPQLQAAKAGPPTHQRAACTTTDFAMQNVILQMNLELLSVDGIKVRKLKSWVTRCGACYTIHTDAESTTGPNNTKRMFCSRCGSDMMQRIAASVDGKSGRLRLHLSKKHKNNLRGSKFALPKAGTNNKYQGDLLLREDQLLYGAWNQKVKNRSGGNTSGKTTSCMFGSDLASNVGCQTNSIPRDDLKIGFGRRNPNATSHGREKRGKKKKDKGSNKACGLRRY